MADFQDYLRPGMRGHLIGIGGVSMAPLAEVLAGMGLVLSLIRIWAMLSQSMRRTLLPVHT